MCREQARTSTRAAVRWFVPILAVVMGAAACTGQASHSQASHGQATSGGTGTDPVSSAPASADPPSPTALPAPVTHAPSQPTSVLSATTPEQASVQISQALFASSPVAVVASADAASVKTASADAEKLGVPLLISAPAPAPGAPAASAAASTPAASAAAASAAASAIDDELSRLGCTRVIVVGAPPTPKGARVVDLSALPPIATPAPLSGTTVLVRRLAVPEQTSSPGASPSGRPTLDPIAATVDAATVTAEAAGATVVPVQGFDPRGDPAAIKALASAPLTHVVAVGAGFGAADRLATRVAVAHTGVQLPEGGQLIFPGHRFVAIYGHPGGAALGILGAQDLDASIARAKQLAAPYQPLSDVPVVPTFEIIATTASGAAGRDGNYSNESSIAELKPWVDKARAAGLYVVLDIQCGRADPLAQAKMYAPLLALPNVGLAVDPEWALTPTELPLQQIGSLDSSRINAVGEWLDSFTAAHHLPQKLFVVHQFTLSMIGHEAALKTDYDNLAILIHMDGQGSPSGKESTWYLVTRAAPKGVPFGWKNFTKEDHPMFTPQQTMAHTPKPMMISYQ